MGFIHSVPGTPWRSIRRLIWIANLRTITGSISTEEVDEDTDEEVDVGDDDEDDDEDEEDESDDLSCLRWCLYDDDDEGEW